MTAKINKLEIETTVIHCEICQNAFRICGWDGASIPYVHKCPSCGSEYFEVKKESIDLLAEDSDYYAEDVDLVGGEEDEK